MVLALVVTPVFVLLVLVPQLQPVPQPQPLPQPQLEPQPQLVPQPAPVLYLTLQPFAHPIAPFQTVLKLSQIQKIHLLVQSFALQHLKLSRQAFVVSLGLVRYSPGQPSLH